MIKKPDTRNQIPENAGNNIVKLRGYKKLIAYQKSKLLVKEIYKLTNSFPKNDFALQNQIQKAVISVPANIAEGQERFSYKEAIRFLYIARASLAEVEVFVDLANDLDYIDQPTFLEISKLIEEEGKLINGLINSLKERTQI